MRPIAPLPSRPNGLSKKKNGAPKETSLSLVNFPPEFHLTQPPPNRHKRIQHFGAEIDYLAVSSTFMFEPCLHALYMGKTGFQFLVITLNRDNRTEINSLRVNKKEITIKSAM